MTGAGARPEALVSALGLDAPGPGCIEASRMRELADRACSFDWAHLGTRDLSIGALLSLIQGTPGLRPPRSGHLGNWEDIARGRAGALDFNGAICDRDVGYPLIYCFNQTENETLTGGDWVYLPGSLASRGVREVLPLYTWNGTALERRSREVPLFVPFVMTEVDGERVPLAQLHARRMGAMQRFDFRLEANIVHDNRDAVRAMLAALLDDSSGRDNPRRAFNDLVSHAASPDGRVARATMTREGNGYRLEDTFFPTTDAFIDAALLPFEAIAEPARFFARLGALPARVPVLSGLLVGIFSAIFCTHYPGGNVDRATMTRPFNPHFHWGARDMAGYPPKRNGYFSERSSIRSIRRICDVLVARFPEVDPVLFLLMPAAIFMLCPSDAHPDDATALSALFDDVLRETSALAGTSDDRMAKLVDAIVAGWVAREQPRLSPYLVHRFNAKRGVLHGTDVPLDGTAREPEGFRRLSVRQACAIVGGLAEAFQPA